MENVADGEQNAIPLRASEHVKLTITLELFQPAALRSGLPREVMSGSVSSIFTVTEVLAENPALLTAVPVMIWLPCFATETGEVQEAIPKIASEQAKLTVTLELFQP